MRAFGQDFALDIYSDADADNDQPLALLIHGGGFQGGDKAQMAVDATRFAERGFRAVSINYPLCRDMFDHITQALHPWNTAQPTNNDNSDCQGVAFGTDNLPDEIRKSLPGPATWAARLAIKYMRTGGRVDRHHVDTSKTACNGASAGAITCYMTLFFQTTIISFPAMTDALVPDPDLNQYGITVAAARAGGIIPGNEDIASVTQETVDAIAPGAAVWDLHSDADTIVPIEASNTTMALADRFGIPHGQVVIEGGGHGIVPCLMGDVLEEMFTFIFDNLANVEGRRPRHRHQRRPCPHRLQRTCRIHATVATWSSAAAPAEPMAAASPAATPACSRAAGATLRSPARTAGSSPGHRQARTAGASTITATTATAPQPVTPAGSVAMDTTCSTMPVSRFARPA